MQKKADIISVQFFVNNLKWSTADIRIIIEELHSSSNQGAIKQCVSVGAHPIWPPRARTLGQAAHPHLATPRISYVASKPRQMRGLA